jgi:hypothetical protein
MERVSPGFHPSEYVRGDGSGGGISLRVLPLNSVRDGVGGHPIQRQVRPGMLG